MTWLMALRCGLALPLYFREPILERDGSTLNPISFSFLMIAA